MGVYSTLLRRSLSNALDSLFTPREMVVSWMNGLVGSAYTSRSVGSLCQLSPGNDSQLNECEVSVISL